MSYLSLILLVTICSFSLTRAQLSICAYENNIDYYISVDLTYVLTSNAQFCCTICGLRPGCVSFTYVNTTQTCFLKSSVTLTSRIDATGISTTTTSSTTYNPYTVTLPTTISNPFTYSTISTLYPTISTDTTTSTLYPTDTTLFSTLYPTITTTTTTTTTTLAAGSHTCEFYSYYNFDGNDFSQAFVADAQACCNACGETPSCQTWTYLSDASYCMMKNSLPTADQISNTSNTIAGWLKA